MNWLVTLGIAATIIGVALSFSYFAQGFRVFKRKSAADLSIFMLLVIFISHSIWLAYGFADDYNLPIVIVNIVGLAGIGFVLASYVRYCKK